MIELVTRPAKHQYMSTGPYLTNIFFRILTQKPVYGNVIGKVPRLLVGSPFFYIVAVGDDVNGEPSRVYDWRASCQKCINSHQREWAGGPCHWRPSPRFIKPTSRSGHLFIFSANLHSCSELKNVRHHFALPTSKL